MKEKKMKRVYKVSEGDVVLISVAANAFSGVACSEVEKRINVTAEKTGITFVVVPNLSGLHVLKNPPKLKKVEDGEKPDTCPKCGATREIQSSGVQCSNPECGYWSCF